MADKTHKKNIRKTKQPFLFLLVGFLILAGIFGGLYAKYIDQESQKSKPIAENFYFTSNLLTEEGKNYSLSLGTDKITFQLRNFEDDLRSSDSNIEYKYTVTSNDTEVRNGNGTITRNGSSGNNKTITIDKISAGKYTITATATSPFTKTLKATFSIPEESTEIEYNINDKEGSAYVMLHVSTKAYAGKVKISWPEGLIPDTTQTAFENINTETNDTYSASNITESVTKYSSYTYRFFKKDTTKDYSTATGLKAEKSTN